jgi:hypothetical protein
MMNVLGLSVFAWQILGPDAWSAINEDHVAAIRDGEWLVLDDDGACCARCQHERYLSWKEGETEILCPYPCRLLAQPMPDGSWLCGPHAHVWYARDESGLGPPRTP